MKQNIAILGSTGSIGITTLNILKKDKKNFNVILLTTNNNVKKIFKQAKFFNVVLPDYLGIEPNNASALIKYLN